MNKADDGPPVVCFNRINSPSEPGYSFSKRYMYCNVSLYLSGFDTNGIFGKGPKYLFLICVISHHIINPHSEHGSRNVLQGDPRDSSYNHRKTFFIVQELH